MPRFLAVLGAIVAAVGVVGTGCSGEPAADASCVGVVVIHGQRYWPWEGTRTVPIIGRPLEARVPNCHDNPHDNAPDETTFVYQLRGVDVSEAVAGAVIRRPPHDGRRIIFVRDAPTGHRDHLPESLRDLVTMR